LGSVTEKRGHQFVVRDNWGKSLEKGDSNFEGAPVASRLNPSEWIGGAGSTRHLKGERKDLLDVAVILLKGSKDKY